MSEPNTIIPDAQLARQVPLRLIIPRSVAIVGVGGVGSWIAMFLALAGVRSLWLWDNDTVSETNLNRLPVGPTYIDINKAVAMTRIIVELTPRCDVVAIPQEWTPSDANDIMIPLPQWIVAATDTHRSRRAIYDWSLECSAGENCGHAFAMHEPRSKFIGASAEGEFGGVAGAPATFITPEEEMPGYASVPVHVGPCAIAAALTCYHILHSSPLSSGAVIRAGWDGSFKTIDTTRPSLGATKEPSV